MTLEVVQIMRAPIEGRHYSIERVFRDVRHALDDRCTVEVWHAPHPSSGLLNRLRNARAAHRLRADVVHVTGDIHYVTLAVRRGIAVVLTVHDLASLDRLSGIRRAVFQILWFTLPLWRAHSVTAVSPATAAQLVDRFPFIRNKLHVIENPISETFKATPATPNTGPFRLLQVGAGDNKNLDRVVQAVSGIRVELTIVGQPRQTLLKALSRNGTAHRVLHNLSDAELHGEYRRCDAVIFASTSEGFGLPVLESQAIGRPVITSDIEPMRDIAGKGALLVDPLNVQAIRDAIVQLQEDKDLRRRLVERGRGNVKRFSPSRSARSYADLYSNSHATGENHT